MSDENRGGIGLHDRHAIGLRLDTGKIGLYPEADSGFMVGIRVYGEFYNYRKEEAMSGFMTLNEANLIIPGSAGGYEGRIAGWEHYKTFGTIVYFKAEECQLLPDYDEYTTFAHLDAYGEEEPWFYYCWGTRRDQIESIGYHSRGCLAYFGVNFPLSDSPRPAYLEIPSQQDLFKQLKKSAPSGEWKFIADFSGFTVDEGVGVPSSRKFGVAQGQRRFHIGVLDLVKTGSYMVGEFDADWEGVQWTGFGTPAEITMLTGFAYGKTFNVTGVLYTGENPPSGYPQNIWLIQIASHPWPPSSYGIKAGDKYILKSAYDFTAHILLSHEEIYDPGTYPPEKFEFTFTPVL